MSISKITTHDAGKIAEFDAVRIDDERMVTASVTKTGTRMKLILWRVGQNGTIERLDESGEFSRGAFPALAFIGHMDFGVTGKATLPTLAFAYRDISDLPEIRVKMELFGIDSGGFGFLSGGSGTVDSASMLTWGTGLCLCARDDASERLHIYQMRVTGNEGQIAGPNLKGIGTKTVNKVGLLTTASNGSEFVTMTTDTTRTKLIRWKAGPSNTSVAERITPDSGEQMGQAKAVSAASRAGGGYITAVKTAAAAKDRLKVHAWTKDLVRQADSGDGGPFVSAVDVASANTDRAVTVAINPAGQLEMRNWKISGSAITQTGKVEDSMAVDQVKVLHLAKNRYVTVVRKPDAGMRLVSWTVD